jgi:hypothetical protein
MRGKRIDSNQPDIVKALRAIPGVTVELDRDDIEVGYKGVNYWFEIKEPGKVSKRTGEVIPSALKPSQVRLRAEWKGHYSIVWSIDQIKKEIGL